VYIEAGKVRASRLPQLLHGVCPLPSLDVRSRMLSCCQCLSASAKQKKWPYQSVVLTVPLVHVPDPLFDVVLRHT
jgi:hypothetical protein